MEWFPALILSLGIGACDGSGDWCAEPVGEVEAEAILARRQQHSLNLTVRHNSDLNDGQDNGNNLGLLRYSYTFGAH